METKGVQISMRKFRLCFSLITKEKNKQENENTEAGVLFSEARLSIF